MKHVHATCTVVTVLMIVSTVSLLAQDYPRPWSEWSSIQGEFQEISFRTRISSYNSFSNAFVYQLEIRNPYRRPVRVNFNMTASCDDEPNDMRWAGGVVASGDTLVLGGSFYWFFPTDGPKCIWWDNLRFE